MLVCCHCEVNYREDEHVHGMDEGGRYEQQEESIIAPCNAGAHPWTVVIELLHTAVANRAVLRSWWPINEACATPFMVPTILNFDEFGGSRSWGWRPVLRNDARVGGRSSDQSEHYDAPHQNRNQGDNHAQVVRKILPRPVHKAKRGNSRKDDRNEKVLQYRTHHSPPST